MTQEAEEAGESVVDTLKQRVFASAFSAPEPDKALARYFEVFEKEHTQSDLVDEDNLEFIEPENEADVQAMLNEIRRQGVID